MACYINDIISPIEFSSVCISRGRWARGAHGRVTLYAHRGACAGRANNKLITVGWGAFVVYHESRMKAVYKLMNEPRVLSLC